jgi:hypothetical protein
MGKGLFWGEADVVNIGAMVDASNLCYHSIYCRTTTRQVPSPGENVDLRINESSDRKKVP